MLTYVIFFVTLTVTVTVLTFNISHSDKLWLLPTSLASGKDTQSIAILQVKMTTAQSQLGDTEHCYQTLSEKELYSSK